MSFLEALGISEGLQILILSMALIVSILVLVRYLSFYIRYRKVRKGNMEMVSDIKKRLKTAKLRSIDELADEQDDEMFRRGFEGDTKERSWMGDRRRQQTPSSHFPTSSHGRLPRESARAKPLVIPATYEARIAKARSKALKKGKRRRRKAPRKKARKMPRKAKSR